jgi:hypothetical protein
MIPSQTAPPFSCEALNILFAQTTFKAFQKPGFMSHYWAPLLSVCSGTGRDDIFFLSPDDIRQQDGIWFMQIRVKNAQVAVSRPPIRCIPVHPTLQRLGFLEFVLRRRETKPTERLFSEYKAGQEHAGVSFSRAFVHWIKTTLSGLPVEKQRLFTEDFHFPSLRARFWVEAEQSGMSECSARWLRGVHEKQCDAPDIHQERCDLERVAAELGMVDIESCFPPLLRYEALMR